VFGPKPRSYETSLNKKERQAAMHAALTDRFQSDAVTVLATDGFDISKTSAFATFLFGSAKAAKTGTKTLVVFAEAELATVGVQMARAGNNLPKVGVTHTGALDVKDVLGYPRLVLTTAAFDQLASAYAHRAGKLVAKPAAETQETA
jgi:large subunit ribosomal protein L4